MAETQPVGYEHLAAGLPSPERRDFLKVLTAATAAIGGAALAWPFIDALAPAVPANAKSNLIVNVGGLAENEGLAVTWAGLPIFVRKLTTKQIDDTSAVVTSTLRDPATYEQRTKPGYGTYVVVIGLNTGSPCQVVGNDPSDTRGPFDGWLCPCDGSVYDPLGRVRSGPAPRNLKIPPFTFLNDSQIQLG